MYIRWPVLLLYIVCGSWNVDVAMRLCSCRGGALFAVVPPRRNSKDVAPPLLDCNLRSTAANVAVATAKETRILVWFIIEK